MDWSVENNKLVKQFSFKSQTELAAFFSQIAKQADSVNHHPDIFVFKAFQLKIELFTHDKKAITEKDHALAKFIDDAFEKFQKG